VVSTNMERQRRFRAHKRGNHDLCHPDRCEALRGPVTAPESAPEQQDSVTVVTPVTPGVDLISPALAKALDDAPLLPRDAAAVAVVRRYAALIDGGDDEALNAIGPKLMRALESLGMTPAGRGAKGGAGVPATASKLDELRARRDRRTG
jgi:hypothetical protein